MTALVFTLKDDQGCLAMDTLVSSAEDRLPLGFQRKFLSLTSAEVLVAGTGGSGLINGWFDFLRAHGQSDDIDTLNSHAPAILNASVTAEGGLVHGTTLYHLGYSSLRHYVGYAFRSTEAFKSEPLPCALVMKPTVQISPADDMELPEFLIDVTVQQQQHERSLPNAQRAGVGGEIEFAMLKGRSTTITTVHRLLFYDDDQRHVMLRSQA